MGTTINTNVVSLNAQRSLAASQSSLSTSMARLSSGLRVNSAKDDAAGLAIAERMNTQIKGMNVAIRNACPHGYQVQRHVPTQHSRNARFPSRCKQCGYRQNLGVND